MSTDPAENAGGMTLSEWHDSANAHDDEDEDEGVELTTYAFMKGSEVAAELDITRPGSLAFVNGQGEITYLHEGAWMTAQPSSRNGTRQLPRLDGLSPRVWRHQPRR